MHPPRGRRADVVNEPPRLLFRCCSKRLDCELLGRAIIAPARGMLASLRPPRVLVHLSRSSFLHSGASMCV
jgi:hypothetical protein